MKNATSLTSRRLARASDIITMSRRFDASMGRRFGRSIAKLIDAGATRCTIDMSAVESGDSGGFGALISALRRLEEAGVHAVVVCANPAIRKLFEVTSVSRLAPVVTSVREARALHAAAVSVLAS